jgi:hypothetical protein
MGHLGHTHQGPQRDIAEGGLLFTPSTWESIVQSFLERPAHSPGALVRQVCAELLAVPALSVALEAALLLSPCQTQREEQNTSKSPGLSTCAGALKTHQPYSTGKAGPPAPVRHCCPREPERLISCYRTQLTNDTAGQTG